MLQVILLPLLPFFLTVSPPAHGQQVLLPTIMGGSVYVTQAIQPTIRVNDLQPALLNIQSSVSKYVLQPTTVLQVQ